MYIVSRPHAFGFKSFGNNDVPWTPQLRRKAAFRVNGMAAVLPSTNFTLEFQYNPTGFAEGGSAYAVGPDDGNNRFFSHFPYNHSEIFIDLGNINNGGRVKISPPPGFFGQDNHIALLFEPGRYRMYQNGELVMDASANGYYAPIAGDLYINGNLGYMGEFRIWTKVRTQEEIRADMNISLGGARPQLLACWRMDEAQVAGIQITDRSGNGYHGVGI